MFVRRAETTVAEAAAASGAVVDGCYGACYPAPLVDDRQDVLAFLPIAGPVLVAQEFASAPVCGWMNCRHATSRSSNSTARIWDSMVAIGDSVRGWHSTRHRPSTRCGSCISPRWQDPKDDAVTQLLWPVVVDASDE